MNLQEIFKYIDGIAIYDWKRLIRFFQSKKLYNNINPPSRQNVLAYVKSESLYADSTDKQLETILFELKNIYRNLFRAHSGRRDYHKINLEKKIFDYKIEIEKLKQTNQDYKKKVGLIDSDLEITKFEKYSRQWGEVQDKILFLSNEVRRFQKELEGK